MGAGPRSDGIVCDPCLWCFVVSGAATACSGVCAAAPASPAWLALAWSRLRFGCSASCLWFCLCLTLLCG